VRAKRLVARAPRKGKTRGDGATMDHKNLFAYEKVPVNLPGGFFIYKATGTEELCFADNNVLGIYGCTTMEELRELTGNSFRGMMLPEDVDRVESEIFAQTFGCGEPHDYVHYRIKTKQGKIKYVEDFGHLVYDQHGECFFYVFIDDVEEAEHRKMSQADWEERIGYRQDMSHSTLTGLQYEKAFYSACERNLANVKINWLMFAIDLQNFKLFKLLNIVRHSIKIRFNKIYKEQLH
jgi:PAS domain S-box-containing protein